MPNEVQRVADLKGNARPIDPDVKIPAAVLRAQQAAEAAHKAAYGEQAPAAPEPKPPANKDQIQIAEPPATPPAEPAKPTPPQPQPTPPNTPEPVTPQGNEPTPAPKQWDPEVELEFQRIRSAEGRKRADILSQLNGAADRIAMLEQQIQELRTAQPPAPAPTPQKLITEQELNEFGPEMLDVMGRRAKETISPELAELRSMMQQLEQKVTGTVQAVTTNAKAAMLNRLDQEIPEWREINKLPEFKAWLALPDPFFGVSRHGALTSAYEKNDTSRVLNFFKGFVSELAASTPDQPVTPPAPAPAKPSLETLAAPGRARTSAQPNAPAEKQIITTADINAFYAAVRKGYYVGREAEQKQLEAELFAAQREGRVRPA